MENGTGAPPTNTIRESWVTYGYILGCFGSLFLIGTLLNPLESAFKSGLWLLAMAVGLCAWLRYARITINGEIIHLRQPLHSGYRISVRDIEFAETNGSYLIIVPRASTGRSAYCFRVGRFSSLDLKWLAAFFGDKINNRSPPAQWAHGIQIWFSRAGISKRARDALATRERAIREIVIGIALLITGAILVSIMIVRFGQRPLGPNATLAMIILVLGGAVQMRRGIRWYLHRQPGRAA